MNELILNSNGCAVLAQGTAERLIEIERTLKQLKEEGDALKTALIAEMESKGIIRLESPELLVSYVAPTYRESLDTKAIQAEFPDIYDAYTKVQPVKSSIRVKIK